MVQDRSAEQSSPQKTHLFMVRLWLVVNADAEMELRGSVQHVRSGEAQHFADGSTLRTFLQTRAAVGR